VSELAVDRRALALDVIFDGLFTKLDVLLVMALLRASSHLEQYLRATHCFSQKEHMDKHCVLLWLGRYKRKIDIFKKYKRASAQS